MEEVHVPVRPRPELVDAGDDQCSTITRLESSTVPSRSAVSALRSKVKALSERREAVRGRDDRGPPTLPRSLGLPTANRLLPSSSDNEQEPQLQANATPRDPLEVERVLGEDRGEGGASSSLDALPWGACEENGVESLSDTSCSLQEKTPWSSPRGFQNEDTPLVEHSLHSRLTGQPTTVSMGNLFPQRKLQRSDSLESQLHTQVEPGATPGGLWRADSWDSVASAGSSLSLAERVELNRVILRQMLSKPRTKDMEAQEQKPEPASEYVTKVALNDSDWDSGISLQDGDHLTRAFVLSDDLPLSPRHEQAKRILERARMKARSNPLKADHNILPLPQDTQGSPSRPPLRRAVPGQEGTTSGNLSDSSSGDSACAPRRRHGQSPTRVRFEDESEKDAEVRYLERLRQRQRAGQGAQGLLVSKPNLSTYINCKKDSGETVRRVTRGRIVETTANSRAWKLQQGSLSNGKRSTNATTQEVVNRKCLSCGSLLDGVSISYINHPSSHVADAVQQSHRKVKACSVNRTVRTEHIKETYIGEVLSIEDRSPGCSHSDSADKGGGDKNRNTTDRLPGTEQQMSDGLVALPPNPYDAEQPGKRCCCSVSLKTQVQTLVDACGNSYQRDFTSTPQNKKSALKSGHSTRLSGQQVGTLMPNPNCLFSHLHCPERVEPSLPQGAVKDPPDPASSCPCQEERQCLESSYGPETFSIPGSSPSSFIRPSVLKLPTSRGQPEQSAPWDGALVAEDHYQQGNGDQCQDHASASPAARCEPDEQVKGPMRVKPPREDSPDMVQLDPYRWAPVESSQQREGRSKLSLCRFFSAMRLNSVGRLVKARSSSMEHLNLPPRHSTTPVSPPLKQHGLLKKAPSLQSLHVGSPLIQLRKASSVQSLQCTKRKPDRSSVYTPGQQPSSPVYRGLQRTLSVEDVGCPSRVWSVGRIAQAFPDGTLLLELSRPSQGPFGFLISRGKGRSDSGIYVEEMGDSSTQKLYAGLLGIGDEILEVNGEKVAGLSLDQVTRLMTEKSTASIRVLRHRRFPC